MTTSYPYLTDAEVKQIEEDATDIAYTEIGPGFVRDYYVNAGSPFAMYACQMLNNERAKAALKPLIPATLGAPSSIDHSPTTKELVLRWFDYATMDTTLEVTVQPHEIVGGFLQNITTHAMFAMRDVGTQIAHGECATCKNVHMVRRKNANGRDESVYCPDCNKPGYDYIPFKRFPRIGGGTKR
jgi:hypothetical protein